MSSSRMNPNSKTRLAPRKRAPQRVIGGNVGAGIAPTHRNALSAYTTALIRTPMLPVTSLVRGQLYYSHQGALGAAAGAVDTDIYGANYMYDPDVSGTGHQPMGFDQYMALYEHFAVIKSTITVTFIGFASGAISRCGVYLSPDATALSSPSQIMENGLNRSEMVDGKDGQPRIKSVTLDCDVIKYFGKKSYLDVLDDEKLTGAATSDPLEGVYFNIFGFCASAATTWAVTYDVMLSYDVLYFEPRKLASS